MELDDLNEFVNEEISGEIEQPILIRIKNYLHKKYDFRYNEVRQLLEFKLKHRKNWIDFEHEHLNSLWIEFQLNKDFKGRGEKPTDMVLDKILYSHFTEKFHPVRNYFNLLKWDGKDHITDLCRTITISDIKLEDDKNIRDYWPSLFRRWLISSVACGLGVSVNQVMLLLIGSQGTYKTTWLNRLCPREIDAYSFTGHINPDLTKNDTADLLAEKFLINIDDQLETIFGKDFNRIKAIITATSITNRKSYRRDAKKRARIANFVGSINSTKIFHDIENRRYLTFQIDRIDIKTEINFNQVWAQAFELYKSGERFWFDSADIEKINAINNQFAFVSHEEEWLTKCYRQIDPAEVNGFEVTKKFVMASEILSILNSVSGLKLSSIRLNNAMKKIGWKSAISKRIDGQPSPRYVFPVQELFVRGDFGRIDVIET